VSMRSIRPPRIPSQLAEDDGAARGDNFSHSLLCGDFSWQSREDTLVEQSRIVQAQFTGARLSRSRLTDVVVENSDFSGAELDEAAIERVEFRECRMSGAIFSRCSFRDVRFVGCRLNEANFRMSEITHVLFEDVELRGSDFYAATMESTGFFDCDLTNAEFTKATIPDVRFHGSTLLDLKGAEYLTGAIIESSQVLPVALAVLAALRIRIDDEREPPEAVRDKRR
jgi:uncharacterized protein YjbI with pentapeptide repeats